MKVFPKDAPQNCARDQYIFSFSSVKLRTLAALLCAFVVYEAFAVRKRLREVLLTIVRKNVSLFEFLTNPDPRGES